MLYLVLFVILFGLLPFLIYLLFYAQLSKETKNIGLFTLTIFLASIYEFIFSYIFQINVKYWFIIYNVIAFISIHHFFYLLLNKKHKVIFLFFIASFLFFIYLYFTIWNKLDFLIISSYFNTLQTIIIVTLSIIWFRRIFINLEVQSLSESPSFYFVAGLLLYYSGTVFLFLLSYSIIETDKNTFFEYWLLNIILNLVLRILILSGIWKGRLK